MLSMSIPKNTGFLNVGFILIKCEKVELHSVIVILTERELLECLKKDGRWQDDDNIMKINFLWCFCCHAKNSWLLCSIYSAARGRVSTTTPSNLQFQRSNSRQGACIYCHQTGHASTACPLQLSASRQAQSRVVNQQNGTTDELLFLADFKYT